MSLDLDDEAAGRIRTSRQTHFVETLPFSTCSMIRARRLLTSKNAARDRGWMRSSCRRGCHSKDVGAYPVEGDRPGIRRKRCGRHAGQEAPAKRPIARGRQLSESLFGPLRCYECSFQLSPRRRHRVGGGGSDRSARALDEG